MVLHKIEKETLIEYSKTPVSTEYEIHDFIERHPEVLEKNMFVIGREVPTGDGNFIDLLGLSNNGDTIIIEVKKDQTPRKVIAQILEYAEWVSNSIGSDELNKIAKRKHLTDYPSLWKKFESEFNEIPDFNEHQRLYIVAEKIDPLTEKLARYLKKNGLDIRCVEINFYEKDGERFCDTKMVVGKEKAVLSEISDYESVNYDWTYYSQRRGWDDDAIAVMKKFADDIIKFGKEERWDLDIKFNRRYCAIQTRTKYNIVALKYRNGMVRIELPALRNKVEPPNSELNWKWSESQSFWIGNFSHNELPSINEFKDVLRKSYSTRSS